MDELMKELDELISLLITESEKIRFDISNRQYAFCVSMYFSLLENSHACVLLLKNYNYWPIPALLRVMYEIDVDLRCLCQDAGYLKNMQASFCYEKKRFFNNAIHLEESNQRLPRKLQIYQEHVAKLDEQLKQLEADGRKHLKIHERFKIAGLKTEYDRDYKILCDDTHNNIELLWKRHIDFEQGNSRVEIFRNNISSDILTCIISIASITTQSFSQVIELLHLENKYSNILESIFDKFDKIDELASKLELAQ